MISGGVVALIMILLFCVAYSNILLYNFFKDDGKLMFVSLVHPRKQQSIKEVIPSGKVMLVRLLQPEKQHSPKEVIPSGRVMLVRLEQS